MLHRSILVLIEQQPSIALHLVCIGRKRWHESDRNALCGTCVSLAANFDRTIFDHDVRPQQRVGSLQVRLEGQPQDRSIHWIDGNLSVVAGILPKLTVSASSRDTAKRYFVVRLFSR